MLALEVISCPIEGSPVFQDDSGTLRHGDLAWRQADKLSHHKLV